MRLIIETETNQLYCCWDVGGRNAAWKVRRHSTWLCN